LYYEPTDNRHSYCDYSSPAHPHALRYGCLDKRLYTSHHAPTDNPDHVKLVRTCCMSPSSVRLSFSRYCTRQPHPCTVLTPAHHPHADKSLTGEPILPSRTVNQYLDRYWFTVFTVANREPISGQILVRDGKIGSPVRDLSHALPQDVHACLAYPKSPSPPSTRTVYRSRLDRGVTTSLPATFFEGLLIRKAHPLYDLYGTLSFILSYSGYFIPLCLCYLSISCIRCRTQYLQSHSFFLFILGERTGSLLGIISLYISDFYISIFSHLSYS